MKTKKPKLSVPREMTEIQTEYQRLCASAGQLQYQLSVHTKELVNLNERLELINREASARQQLDKEAKARAEAPSETKTEEVAV